MVEPSVKVAPKAKAGGKKEKSAKKGVKGITKKTHGSRKNYDLGNGVYLFSRKNNKTALYKYVHNKKKKATAAKKPTTIEKKIGGEKNGGTRVVQIKKKKNYFPTMDRIRAPYSRKLFSQHKRKIRPSLTPGTVVILLAGVHKGKRVIFMKQLPSGLLLVNGPFRVNATPMRRVSQHYVIATQTKVDFTGLEVPAHINDDYFKRKRDKRVKKEEGDIFNKKKDVYKPSAVRKTDQKTVDNICRTAITKMEKPTRYLFYKYLKSMFGIRSSQYPHRLHF